MGLWLGLPWAAAVFLLSFDLWLLLDRRPWILAEGPSLRGAWPSFLAVLMLLAVTRYPLNRGLNSGEFVLDPLGEDDAAFHAGLTWELTLGHPPQVPGLSGFPLRYHLGSDWVRAAALHFFGLKPYDALTRWEPTLSALALLLALRAMAHALGAGTAVIAAVPWTLLATDFSFFLFGRPGIPYWTDFFRGNILLALVLDNAVVPALALALGSLVALHRHLSGQGGGWLWLAGLLAAAVPFFKVFLGAQLLLGLGLCFALGQARYESLLVALGASLATLFLVGGQDQSIEVALAPLVPVALPPPNWSGMGGAIGRIWWAIPWTVGSLGLRLLGLSPAVRALRSKSAPAIALAVMALSGWPLGLLFRISTRELMPGQKIFNEAAYFFEQSGVLLWIFTVVPLASLAGRGRRAVFVCLACAALALPSTFQFVARKVLRPTHVIPAAVMQAMGVLAGSSQPGDVVLQRPAPRYPPPPVVFLGRRVPYTRFTPYLTQFAARAALDERLETVRTFFRTTDPLEARRIADSLGATHVCLYDSDEIHFDSRGVLQPLYETPEARVYRILNAAPEVNSGAAIKRGAPAPRTPGPETPGL